MDHAALDTQGLAEALRRFTAALEAHREELDSLNVFPVPDGDTGTNLLLTMRGVMAALDGRDPDRFATTVADAALMSARGNSGVIFAQVLRALVDGLLGDGTSARRTLARALGSAASEARRAVARPVEGTVLTVLADAASAAGRAADGAASDVASAARDAAAESLRRTTAAVPELAAAGVVDAGGLGALLLLDALASVANGSEMTVEVGRAGPVGSAGAASSDQDVGFKFEVMFLLRIDDERLPEVRDRLDEMGDSLVVVGSDGRYRVHLHTDEADGAVALAGRGGTVEDVRVVDLEEQVAEACVAGQARAVRMGERRTTGLVVVAEGDGIASLFRSLGAAVASPGNAATGLGAAVSAVTDDAVVVLPTDQESFAVAERVAGESGRDIWVVFARTIPEALSAAAAFNPTESPAAVAERMAEAVGTVATASVRRADDAWIGTIDGDVVAHGTNVGEAAVGVLSPIRTDEHEILTVLTGEAAGARETRELLEALASAFADLRIEHHVGGQPGEAYVFGLE
ncbi:MAG TPA: DAK2 domain-containing protein [Actinomycetota bacterium]